MEEILRQQLAQALHPLSSNRATLLLEKGTQITRLPAPFFAHYQIYQAVNYLHAYPLSFYLAYTSPVKPAYLFTSDPQSYQVLARSGEVELPTTEQAADYATMFLTVTRPLSELFYLLNSVNDIHFYPTMDEKEAARKQRFLQDYTTIVTPAYALFIDQCYSVTLYAMRQQTLEHHTLTIERNGEISEHVINRLEDMLPTLYSA